MTEQLEGFVLANAVGSPWLDAEHVRPNKWVAKLPRYGPTRRKIVIGTEPSGRGATFHESSSRFIT